MRPPKKEWLWLDFACWITYPNAKWNDGCLHYDIIYHKNHHHTYYLLTVILPIYTPIHTKNQFLSWEPIPFPLTIPFPIILAFLSRSSKLQPLPIIISIDVRQALLSNQQLRRVLPPKHQKIPIITLLIHPQDPRRWARQALRTIPASN